VLVRLDAVVRRAGGGPDDLDAVVAARGPGSFTGLRVGLSLAAGLAYARHIPLYVADSLPILARRASGDPATVALRDAGRREVYAWREGEVARRLSVDELAGWLPAAARVMVEPAGSLAGWVPGLAHLEVPPAERRPLSAALLDSANWTFDSQKPLRYDEVQALYVQPAAAEERRRKAP
jgi:tRNA threonylcarbamoyladenosine biosynthesis protein TsaB